MGESRETPREQQRQNLVTKIPLCTIRLHGGEGIHAT